MSLVKTIKSIKRGEAKIITPTVERWLTNYGDSLGIEDESDFELLKRLALASKTNSKRDGRFGASARGTCERKQVYAFLGLPHSWVIDPELQNIFNDGTMRHWKWQLMGMKAGIFTDVEVGFALPEWRLGISMDAINDADPTPWVFELKGTSGGIGKLKTQDDISDPHIKQIHTYLFATGWERAIYLAEDKRSQAWAEVVVNRDERIILEVKRELNRLNDAIESQAIPEVQDDCRRKRGTQYRQCPYKEGCLHHYTQGDPWPDDGEWPRDIGTSVSVGRRVRPAGNAKRAS